MATPEAAEEAGGGNEAPPAAAAAAAVAGADEAHAEAPEHAPASAPPECMAALAQAEAALGGGRHADALAGFRAALDRLRADGGTAEGGQLPASLQPLELQLLDGVVSSQQSGGQLDEALAACGDILMQAAAYGRVPDEAMACLALADVLAEKGAPHLGDAARVLALSDTLGDSAIDGVGSTQVPYLRHLMVHVDSGEFLLEDAPPAVASYLQSPSAQGWQRATGGQCFFGGGLHLLEAIQWFERMADLSALSGRERAQALGSLGTVYAKLGQRRLAATLFQEVVQYGAGAEDQFAVSRAASGLGAALDAMAFKDIKTNWLSFSNLQIRAIEAHTQAREAYAALGNKAEVAQCYFRIANGHALLRDHHEAIAKLRFAQAIAVQMKDVHVQADAVREMGLQYQLLAQHRTAVEVHESDYKLQVQLGRKSGIGRASRNLAVSKRALGGHKQALKLVVSYKQLIAKARMECVCAQSILRRKYRRSGRPAGGPRALS